MAEATKRGTESVSLGRLPVSALLRGAAAFPFPLHAPESSLLSLARSRAGRLAFSFAFGVRCCGPRFRWRRGGVWVTDRPPFGGRRERRDETGKEEAGEGNNRACGGLPAASEAK